MTDNELPSQRQFMTRRERREYERRLAEAHSGAESNDEEREDVHHPDPIDADGPGGLQEQPTRPGAAASQAHSADQERQYSRDINADRGGLAPLPQDQRGYPQPEPSESSATDDDSNSGDDDPDALGYMLVADGRVTAPEPDEHEIQQRKSRKRKRTIVMLSSFAVFLGLLAIVGLGVGQLVGWTNNDYPGPGGAEVVFEVNPGEGPIVIGNRLVEQDIVASTSAFRDAVETVDASSDIQPGEYTLRYEMPARDAAEIFLRVGEPGMNYVHVNSGHRINDVFDNLAERTEVSVEEWEEAANPANFDVPAEAETLEGYVAVGEYHFPFDASAQEVLEEMIAPTMEEFDRLGVTEPAEQHRLVTIASIIEAEARPDDYEIVAGIIENRLDPSNTETMGLLQIDATLIYGMGVRQLQFSAEDRRNADNEYNTYVHRGLPPGPIGAPSIAALDAAADPEPSDYYYWITTNIETGETKFSSTLEQHQEYQEEYRAYCDDNPDICGRD